MGHVPVRAELGADAPWDDADAVVVEAACPFSLAAALRVRETRPEIGVVCATVRPDRAAFTALEQMTFLVKPFALSELEDALQRALPDAP